MNYLPPSLSAGGAGTDPAVDDWPVGLLIVDQDESIVSLNPQLSAWLQQPAGPFAGQPLAALLPPASLLLWHTHLRPMLHLAGQINEAQLLLQTRDGQMLPMVASIRLQPLPQGSGHRTLWVLQPQYSRDRIASDLRRVLRISQQLPGMAFEFEVSLPDTIALPFVSEGARELLGVAPEALQQRPERWFELLEPSEAARLRTLLTDRQQDGHTALVRLKLRPSGARTGRWIEISAQCRAGGPALATLCWYGFAQDINDRVEQQEMLALALEAGRIGTWRLRPDSGEVEVSEESARLIGYHADELPRNLKTLLHWIHPDDRRRVHEALRAHLADPTRPYRFEFRRRHRDGRWIWHLTHGSVTEWAPDGRPERMFGVHVDISELKDRERRLEKLATTDALTGLPNRTLFGRRLEQALAAKQQDPTYGFAVLFLDIDRFKQINDTFGHPAGDAMLKILARRIKHALRGNRGFVGRFAGDEFVVLLDGIDDLAQARTTAARLARSLAEPMEIGGLPFSVDLSIGIAGSALPYDDVHTLLRDAETAMYEAKRQGRGRCVEFDPAMHARVIALTRTEAELRDALKRGQLTLAFQPVVSLKADGRCVGAEALARWPHPVRGMIPPTEFIPLAESCGLIGELGAWVLATACERFTGWQRRFGRQAPEFIAVNLSIAQLYATDFVERVVEVLRQQAMPPQALQIEVTESMAAQDPLIQQRLADLQTAGIRLSLDDFGTGYSSLSNLHELAVNVVKIDRSFVIRCEHSEYHKALIEATVRFAGTLGLSTVAEGVETAAQAALITSLGVEKAQGYLYSKPLPAADFERWLAAGSA